MIKWIIIGAIAITPFLLNDNKIEKCIRVEKISGDTIWDHNGDIYINKGKELKIGEMTIVNTDNKYIYE